MLSVGLAPAPADRFASIGAMATALGHTAPALPVRCPDTVAPSRERVPITRAATGPRHAATGAVPSRPHRRPLALAVIAAALVVAVAMGARATAIPGRPAVAVVPSDGVVTLSIAGVEHRYRLGAPGDLVLVGDWTCGGAETVGLYRPATGRALEFGAGGGSPIATAQLAPHHLPLVRRGPDGCDMIAV